MKRRLRYGDPPGQVGAENRPPVNACVHGVVSTEAWRVSSVCPLRAIGTGVVALRGRAGRAGPVRALLGVVLPLVIVLPFVRCRGLRLLPFFVAEP